jgi:transcriptional regulator of acetoin/glycerol metabolism
MPTKSRNPGGQDTALFQKVLSSEGGDGFPTLAAIEKALIERTARELGWNRTASAKALGIDRRTLYRKLRRFGLDRIGGKQHEAQ